MSDPPSVMTVEEFLDWETPDGSDRWELVDGTPIAIGPSSLRHGAIHAEAARLIGNHLRAVRPECRALIRPGVRPGVFGDNNVRVPDIAVTCMPLVATDRLLSEPLVLVEIFSPSGPKDTWGNVWTYLTIPSVVEVLVLHTDEPRADLLRRRPDGEWPVVPLALGKGDSVHLQPLGFLGPLFAFYRTAGLPR